MVIVGLTFAVLVAFGNAGENVAVPLAVLHVVPTVAAPAGAALRPIGSVIAATATSPVMVRILKVFLSAAGWTAGGAVEERFASETEGLRKTFCEVTGDWLNVF
jgi:phage-related minor tail protein